MQKYRLDYKKYKERLKTLFPKFSEEELKEYFRLRVDFWEMILEKY